MTQNSLPALQCRLIKKSFGYRPILKGISLSIKPGQQTLLLGKNGSGKTTLLKILSGLMRPASGEVLMGDTPIDKVPTAYRQALGVISHANHFYNELSAIENLHFFSKLRGVEDLKSKIDKALYTTGLLKVSEIPIKTYSSGMLKRLNIAKLMVCEPNILLLDEPYTGLDYDSCEFFNRFLTGFKENNGTILMISHQIETCLSQTDQVLILEEGVIKEKIAAKSYSAKELIDTYKKLTI